jgi:hypothetical protein
MSVGTEMGGDKPNRARSKVRNAETTLTILRGAPVFFAYNGTDDGLAAKSAVSLAAAVQTFFAGVALQDIGVGKIREVIAYGHVAYARYIIATRAASTDVWASYSAGALGDVLSVNTATNDGAGQQVQAFSRAGAGSGGSLMPWNLAETYASATTQASSLGGSSIFSIGYKKIFIRSM